MNEENHGPRESSAEPAHDDLNEFNNKMRIALNADDFEQIAQIAEANIWQNHSLDAQTIQALVDFARRKLRRKGLPSGTGLSLLDALKKGRELEIAANSAPHGKKEEAVHARASELGVKGSTGTNCRTLYRTARDAAFEWYCDDLALGKLDQDPPEPDKLDIHIVLLFAKGMKADRFPNDVSWLNTFDV